MQSVNEEYFTNENNILICQKPGKYYVFLAAAGCPNYGNHSTVALYFNNTIHTVATGGSDGSLLVIPIDLRKNDTLYAERKNMSIAKDYYSGFVVY